MDMDNPNEHHLEIYANAQELPEQQHHDNPEQSLQAQDSNSFSQENRSSLLQIKNDDYSAEKSYTPPYPDDLIFMLKEFFKVGRSSDKEAIKKVLRKALYNQRLDAEHLYSLGTVCLENAITWSDPFIPARLLTRAAEMGHPMAQYCVAHLYCNGQGVERSMPVCTDWLLAAAKNGIVDAQIEIADYCYSRAEVLQDYQQAQYWYGKAAESGDINGQYGLAVIYSDPKTEFYSPELSRYWFHVAAERQHPLAMSKLAQIYWSDTFTPRPLKASNPQELYNYLLEFRTIVKRSMN